MFGDLAHLVGAVLLLLPALSSGGVPEGPSAAVKEYLSEDYFPGLTLLEPVPAEGRLRAYVGGQLPEAAAPGREELVKTLDPTGWSSMKAATEAVGAAAEAWTLEPLQTPWAIFDKQGWRINTVKDLLALPVAFFLEIGVWMWPAVRVGFEQAIQGVGNGTAVLRTLALRPKVFEVRDFMSDPETEEVMEIGQQQGLAASQGSLQSADRDSGRRHDNYRTSTQAWLGNGLAPVIQELDERVSDLTRVPASHNEPVQLLRYGVGNYYHSHMDWTELELYNDQKSTWESSHFGFQDRLATVFWYLNDVPVGGETFFPKHGQPICKPHERGGPDTRHCKGAHDPAMTTCDIKGLKVEPRRGAVLLWYNFHASGRGDRNALHAGCPVGEGYTKWSGNKWVRIKPLTARASWIKDHPALKRSGWRDVAAKPDNNECVIIFVNDAEEDVDLMWVPPSGGELVKMQPVPTRDRSSTDSFIGHKFALQAASGRKTETVACTSSQVIYRLGPDFSLELHKGKAEL